MLHWIMGYAVAARDQLRHTHVSWSITYCATGYSTLTACHAACGTSAVPLHCAKHDFVSTKKFWEENNLVSSCYGENVCWGSTAVTIKEPSRRRPTASSEMTDCSLQEQ